MGLNDRVRDGNGCDPHAIATNQCDGPLKSARYAALADPFVRSTGEWRERGGLDAFGAFTLGCPADFFLVVCDSTSGVNPGGAGQATRAISTARLHTSRCFHLPPIDVVISHGPSEPLTRLGVLILGWASHLDAFSGYPFPTSLPGDAPGGTTGTRVVGPSRSSRTRDGSPQHSNARDGYRPNCLTTF